MERIFVCTVQLRYNGRVTELQDTELAKKIFVLCPSKNIGMVPNRNDYDSNRFKLF